MKLIDADKLSADMYHEAFAKDSDMQKWDNGCWIRYKMFEDVLKAQPTVQPNTTTHDSIPAKTGKNDEDRTSGDCISRQAAIDALKEKVFHNLSDEFYGAMQVLDELPSAQPELKELSEWKADFKGYINDLNMPKDDYDGIMEYIDEVPSVQPEIIRCKDCINYIDHRCTVADHHVAPFSCCQSVFGAKMKAGE